MNGHLHTGVRLVSRTRTSVGLVILTMLGSIAVSGCPCKTDENSGGDHTRGKAMMIQLDQIITDEIYPEACDNTDWKMLQVGTSGFLTVSVFWDNDMATGRISLFDRFGNQMETKEHTTVTAQDSMVVRVEPAFYYIKVEGYKLRSTYSVQAFFESKDPDVIDSDEPIPEFDRPIE